MHTYAIGDIHGHLDLLQAAHQRIERDMALHGAAPIVHVGDLVDRGPDSAGVVEYLRSGIENGQNWIVLKGNHDRLLSRFLDDPAWHDPGLKPEHSYMHPKIGGGATLASYGVANAADRPLAPVHAEAVAAVPQSHRDFLASRPVSFRRGECFFCHAGVRPTRELEAQAEQDLIWIRKDFLDFTDSFGPLIVHGHTAIAQATSYGNRLNTDSSAAYGGPLSAVVIEGRDAFLLTDEGRKPIPAEPHPPA
ncbi:metallophosphoesterase [Falsirhodobacter sp. alg1]|uniref:metallophosphoesterase n=1 Tax=Falsirhodobacter sp. alg1 TaxID=1472418 RepID=UPI0005F01FF3|nr:metallophosphoesterase [Falsirhodobacter sp. alg1]